MDGLDVRDLAPTLYSLGAAGGAFLIVVGLSRTDTTTEVANAMYPEILRARGVTRAFIWSRQLYAAEFSALARHHANHIEHREGFSRSCWISPGGTGPVVPFG